MDKESFETLLEAVRFKIERKNTQMREAVSARERLIVTLRYLATGRNIADILHSRRSLLLEMPNQSVPAYTRVDLSCSLSVLVVLADGRRAGQIQRATGNTLPDLYDGFV
nr:unnamed protein product [Callosobruchus chinensis]